jgi:hypothetical protein
MNCVPATVTGLAVTSQILGVRCVWAAAAEATTAARSTASESLMFQLMPSRAETHALE